MALASRLALAVLLTPATGASTERIWAELEHPYAGQRIREPAALVEIRGWAGTGIRGQHDVVVVIDRSASTFRASGVDVDGDGVIGAPIDIGPPGGPAQIVVSDPGDTIAEAERLAARRLVEHTNPDSTRLAIVTFGLSEHVRAGLGSDRAELLASLDTLPKGPAPGGTDFYGAILRAIRVFEEAPARPDEIRHRSIILLSDGFPNVPSPRSFAEKAALRASQHAARARIRIYSFALGVAVSSRPRVFRELAEATGGELMLVERPGEIIDYVPHMSLTRLRSIEVENLTSGRRARAVRLFPDGSFDGYAPLVPGPNLLRVTIRSEAGAEKQLHRRVTYQSTPADTPGGRRRLEIMLERLRIRTFETELAEKARRRLDRVRRRTLRIEVED